MQIAFRILANTPVWVFALLQYGIAVATAIKLEPHAAVATIGHAVSGASAGYFSGGRRRYGAVTGISTGAKIPERKSRLAP